MKDYIDKEGLKTIGKYINQKDAALATSISEIQTEIATKQDTLISGTNIKTINGDIILGSGDLVVNPDEATELEIKRLFRTEYSVTTSITNGTYSGDSSIWTEETAAVILSANTGYNLPDEIVVSGANYIYTKDSGLVDLVNAEDNVTISAECPKAPPSKGAIITLNGEPDRYRILKVNGNVVQLLRLGNYQKNSFSDGASKQFDNGRSGIKYEASSLDTLLNTTYYNSLSTAIKNAIVPENRIQNMYSRADGSSASADFRVQRSDGNWYSYTKLDQTTVGERNIYTLDISDIVEYLGTDIIYTDLLTMFFEQTTSTGSDRIWTSSATNESSTKAYHVIGEYGFFVANPCTSSYQTFPAFSIDLSQVSWVAK